MRSHKVILLFIVVLISTYGYSQDYVYATQEIDKVEIVANTGVILKTHKEPNLLISSLDNRRMKTNTSGLKPTFTKDNTGFNVFVEQNDRRLQVESFQERREAPLIVYLPETIKVSVESRSHNDIIILGFSSDIEAKTNHGDIRIEKVTGPLILENSHGNTYVIFSEVSQKSPISIVNSIGDIDITLPSDTNADIELSVRGGDLYTDHDLVSVDAGEEETGETRTSRFLNAKLNQGGVSIMILASRGDVYLRKQ